MTDQHPAARFQERMDRAEQAARDVLREVDRARTTSRMGMNLWAESHGRDGAMFARHIEQALTAAADDLRRGLDESGGR